MLSQGNNLTYFVIQMNVRSCLIRVLEQGTKSFAYSLLPQLSVFSSTVYLVTWLSAGQAVFCQMVSYAFGLISSFRLEARSWRTRPIITTNNSIALPLFQALFYFTFNLHQNLYIKYLNYFHSTDGETKAYKSSVAYPQSPSAAYLNVLYNICHINDFINS